MQLTATKSAQFFIQNEYHIVEVLDDRLIVQSESVEETIPFNIWNGKVLVKPGILWGSLQFFAHQDAGIQQAWLVQGLPLSRIRDFARHAVAIYQQWHKKQCAQLNLFLPQWEEQLGRMSSQPNFLTHAQVAAWLERIEQDLVQMEMSLEDATLRMPKRMSEIEAWVENPEGKWQVRNDVWMSNELDNWQVLFSQIESSPLNYTQRKAVLLNDNNNLILAGAGSGKTSVLTARVAYLLQSHSAVGDEVLMLAFGRDAAQEMSERLSVKLGSSADSVKVCTFHQLGLQILNQVEPQPVTISPIALDDKLRQAWCIDWLKKHWMTPTNFKRWQKHLAKWPIAYLAGDEELGSHVENPKLIAWLEQQVSQLAAVGKSKKEIQQSIVSHPEYSRLNSELGLIWPCYQAWSKQLKEQGHIDFNLMISRATDYVKQRKFQSPWRYIMIDEYQDISPQRLQLVEALCEQNENSVLFAVGDDWQSIYQFAGSDVDLITGFSERFPYSTVHHLDTTYRFNNKLGEVANTFVQRNPAQLPKELRSHKEQKSNAVTVMPATGIEKVLDKLNRAAKKKQTVLLLGRNHYHKPELLADWQNSYRNLAIQFMTCHASKGKEADYVILVGVDEGQFPARVKALHIDGALTKSNETFAYAEERRLFYVALTRAKRKVWVTYNSSGSAFVRELVEQDYPVIESKK